MSRWLRFQLVGALGFALQLGLIALLTGPGRVHYLVATAIAVEAAVVHNFVWHLRYTWRDREARGRREVLGRLVRFHLANGAVSLGGNLALMSLLVGRAGLPPLAANLVTVTACSLVNFLLGDRMVFRPSPSIEPTRA